MRSTVARAAHDQTHLIELSFESVEVTKPYGERKGKEKPKEHLHTETCDPKFLKEIAQVAIVAFGLGLSQGTQLTLSLH